ncbi:MAG TPA: isocitrate lyase/phosphoenolpyruvate mutase family protein, partial [Polyangiaceae bacterium]|jgi:2-methylisocitrate lyase-like PEP mutase family enzyme|nr:isocitrate lyase/phosphoenolpyruvate mutase family protein [Polyangiaceae bacterium]
MNSQTEKAEAFRVLHERESAFVLPNPWDVGSARLLAGLGFEALASTSAGFARAIGTRDYRVGREQVMRHVKELAGSVELPMSGDLENGFGDSPEDAAEAIRLAAEAGLVGGSIEDSTGRQDSPQYGIEHATERIRAAAEAARRLPFPFILTARAENFFTGTPDLADAIRRLQCYQEAGADVLYAPLLRTAEDIQSVVASVDRPVNVLLGPREALSVGELASLGVKRISLGSVLSSVATSAVIRAARQILETSTFTLARDTEPGRSIDELIARGTPTP